MSQAMPVGQSQRDAALIRKMLRRRRSTHVLYWRLKRPRARVYVGAVIRLVLYRVIAGAVAAVDLAISILAGAAAGNIGYPRWSAFEHMNPRIVHTATIQALSGFPHLAPAALALALPLVVIPRPPQWLFSMTLWAGVATGYFNRVIPPLQAPRLASEISRYMASVNSWVAHLTPTTSLPGALIPFAVVVIAGAVIDRSAYRLLRSTVNFLPHRPASHYRSTFSAVSPARRATAAILTTGLLIADLWISVNLRRLLHAFTDVGSYYWRQPLSILQSVIIITVVAVIICAPRPQGYRGLLILLLTAVTVYTVWPHRIFPAPDGIPVMPYNFWVLVLIYIVTTGVIFDSVSALLDWRG